MISRRRLEAATATLTGAFGAAVAASSLQNGIGWSSAGVDAGTFPFMTGLIILGGSLVNLALGWRAESGVMLGRYEMKKLGGLFLPAAAFVGAIPLIGVHVAAALYIFGTLALQHRVATLRALAIAAVTAVSLYVVFDRMFQVSLPLGLLGDALGL
jgi:hypothetical protein